MPEDRAVAASGSRWARRLFFLGCITLIVTAALHLIGHLAGPPQPANDTEKQLFDLMHSYRFEIFGTQRTSVQLVEGYSLYYSISLACMGVLGWIVARASRRAPMILGAVAMVFAIASAAFAGIAYFRWVPPPMICHAAGMLAFGAAALLARGGPAQTT